jgi:hypothetical protein
MLEALTRMEEMQQRFARREQELLSGLNELRRVPQSYGNKINLQETFEEKPFTASYFGKPQFFATVSIRSLTFGRGEGDNLDLSPKTSPGCWKTAKYQNLLTALMPRIFIRFLTNFLRIIWYFRPIVFVLLFIYDQHGANRSG